MYVPRRMRTSYYLQRAAATQRAKKWDRLLAPFLTQAAEEAAIWTEQRKLPTNAG